MDDSFFTLEALSYLNLCQIMVVYADTEDRHTLPHQEMYLMNN